MTKIINKNWLVRFVRFVMTWRHHRRIIKELNAMSDKELSDIGINRSDIDRIIWLNEDKEKRGK